VENELMPKYIYNPVSNDLEVVEGTENDPSTLRSIRREIVGTNPKVLGTRCQRLGRGFNSLLPLHF